MATTIIDNGTMHFEVDDIIIFHHREGRVGISIKRPKVFGFRLHDSYEFSISLVFRSPKTIVSSSNVVTYPNWLNS